MTVHLRFGGMKADHAMEMAVVLAKRQGIRTGLIAASIALALLAVAYEPAVMRFKSDVGFIPLSYDPNFVSSLARDLLLAGALLGALGSYIGVRRYVRI